MDYQELKYNLEEHIHELSSLLGRLSNEGKPLTKDDKALIRETLAGKWLRGHVSEMKFGFLDGDDALVASAQAHISETLSQLI